MIPYADCDMISYFKNKRECFWGENKFSLFFCKFFIKKKKTKSSPKTLSVFT